MDWFYYIGRLMVRTLLLLLTRWQVKGRANIPDHGPLLVVANHLHLADPPILAVSLGRKAIFMAKEELFRSRFSRYFISRFGAFPVSRRQLDRKAIQQAGSTLEEGGLLIMFPESTRSQNAQLQAAFSGSALIALRNSVPVLPVGITGSEKIKGITWLLRRPRIEVNIGPPFRLPPTNGKMSKAELAESTDFMMGHIARLLPPEYQGKYAASGRLDVTKG